MAHEQYLTVLIPAAALAADALAQVAAARASRGAHMLRSVSLGFLAGFVALLALSALDHRLRDIGAAGYAPLFIVNAITYGALGFGYFHFINLGTTARRVRILLELRDSPEGLTYGGIQACYAGHEMLGKRLDRLIGSGQVRLRKGRYTIASGFLLLAARMVAMAKAILLGHRHWEGG